MFDAPSPAPIFIIGAPRSGTSVMTWALGQHPNIQPMPETVWISSAAVGAVQTFLSGSDRGKLSHLSNVEYPLDRFLERHGQTVNQIVHEAFDERRRQTYGEERAPSPAFLERTDMLFLCRSSDEPKTRWVDGTPLNTHYTWALAQMFPTARFLHHVRQPQQVVASLEKFDRVGATPQDREEGLQTWTRHATAAWLTERGLGSDRVFRVDFRRIENDTNALLNEILAFLGEEPCRNCLDPFVNRLNSSGTHGDDHSTVLDGVDGYEQAQTLYEQIVGTKPVYGAGEPEALAELEMRFKALAQDRSLVG